MRNESKYMQKARITTAHHLHDLHSGPLTSSTLPTLRPPGGGPPPLPPLPPPKPQPGLLPGVLLLALKGDAAAAAAGSNYEEKVDISTGLPKKVVAKRKEMKSLINRCGDRKTTYGEESGQVEAKKDVGIVKEVADAHGGWWTRRSGYVQLS